MSTSILLLISAYHAMTFMVVLYLFVEATQVPRNLTSSIVSKILPLLDVM